MQAARKAAPPPSLWKPVIHVNGLLIAILGLVMVVPALVDAAVGNRDWMVFAMSAITTFFLGASMALATRERGILLSLRQGFLLTATTWTLLPIAGAVPFLYAEMPLDVPDALFEAVSGMTTTGSTVIVGLDALPPGLLLWRSLLQWTGGIGIIVMAIAILPFLRVGGMQLFRTESSDRYEKALPGAAQMVKAILAVYSGLTVACGLSYWLAGMSPFDAVNHALTTLPTGGFSTHDASFGYFQEPLLHWLAVLFMISGALPFTLYVTGFSTRRWKPLFKDAQVRLFLASAGLTAVLLTLVLVTRLDQPSLDAVRVAAFNVVSVITTTGYASADYSQWGPFAAVVFFYLTFSGACAGSTTGGLKMLRVGIMIEIFKGYIRRLIYPTGVFPPTFNGRKVEVDVMASVMVFTLAFAATIGLTALVLGAFRLDLVTSLTAAATAVANVGPGLGPIVGPSGNFATLPDGAKITLAIAMILGRLEIFTILVLFAPIFWKS